MPFGICLLWQDQHHIPGTAFLFADPINNYAWLCLLYGSTGKSPSLYPQSTCRQLAGRFCSYLAVLSYATDSTLVLTGPITIRHTPGTAVVLGLSYYWFYLITKGFLKVPSAGSPSRWLPAQPRTANRNLKPDHKSPTLARTPA